MRSALHADALEELNADEGSDPGVAKRSNTMVFLDLGKRAKDPKFAAVDFKGSSVGS